MVHRRIEWFNKGLSGSFEDEVVHRRIEWFIGGLSGSLKYLEWFIRRV